VRFGWIAGQRTLYPLSVMCRALGVTRGGYYAWERRREQPPGERERRRAELATEIRAVHHDSRRTYGSPRVYHELKARGVDVCENTVAKVMRQEGIRSITRRRFRVRTTDSSHAHPVAPNLLDRDFAAQAPDRKWAADITYVPTGEGWLYLAVVLDLCTRRVVGWAMADHLRSELCLDALDMALKRRRPGQGLLHHSDRGCSTPAGITGICYDRKGSNAP